ncbi:DUF3108 domain-containing protein [Alloalcanivorax marinus]|uniref:DUF3108 domain-containing protein n=1 Tax=Alloalcanivorax marinus TaxID=1177169 RepID=UPI0019330EB6|nr:DUF3108 domain-containing protein [Alloalcanivorax marinus]MBL7249110.1 DUF3108 domain-containing protein [Alloalcanivorax marinus]
MAKPCPPRAFHRALRLSGLLAALTLGSTAMAAPPVAAFQSEYRLKAAGFPFSVGATRSLSPAANGGWKMEVKAKNFIGEIRETSLFEWQGCVPVTRYYGYRRAGLGRVKTAELRIDPATHRATSERSGHEPRDYDAGAAATDEIALPLALQCMLSRDQDNLTLRVADEREVETHRYQVEGRETLEVGDREVATIKVRRVRERDNGRETWLWFAPEHDYALVQLVQRNNDGRHVLRLENLP